MKKLSDGRWIVGLCSSGKLSDGRWIVGLCSSGKKWSIWAEFGVLSTELYNEILLQLGGLMNDARM